MFEINYENWGWPQWAVLILFTVNLISSAYLHGKPRSEPNYNFTITVHGVIIWAVLLIFGGFW